jgi:hypothetical protein
LTPIEGGKSALVIFSRLPDCKPEREIGRRATDTDDRQGIMNRRQLLSLAAASAGWVLLCGHSPYRQWMVYRETHLIILTSRDDLGADDLGEKFAAIVRGALPDSRAAVGRGPKVQRIASLISTRQAEVGVVSRSNALAMYRGEGPFQQYGAIPLRVLVQNDAYRLVCRDDFLPQHGYLLTEALMEHASMEHASMEPGADLALSVPGRDAADAGEIPPHVGALAFAEGRSLDGRVGQ